MTRLFIPEQDTITEENVWEWYQNIIHEVESGIFLDNEKEYLVSYYKEAGLLSFWRSAFFRRHFSESFAEAAEFMLSKEDQITIVDLGCGCGSQTLFFALCGARVIAVDLDEVALSILQKRLAFYQEYTGKVLKVEVVEEDTFGIDYSGFGEIDGIYSMFAFNMMQPSHKLFKKLNDNMMAGGKVAVIDGNNRSLYARLCPWRKRDVWSPNDFRIVLEKNNWLISKHQGKVVIPPHVWAVFPYFFLKLIDSSLINNWLFPVSHQILAEKNGNS